MSCDPEFGDPKVPGVEVEPGDVKLGSCAPPGQRCAVAGHGKPL